MDAREYRIIMTSDGSMKREIITTVDDLQKGVRLLIDLPCRVTINTDEYRIFYDKVQSFVGRFNLVDTNEWLEVDRWLIKKPNEYLTLEEAGHIKLALEKLRMRALDMVGGRLTEEEKCKSEERIDESFKELREIGQKQVELLANQNDTLRNSNKSVQRWNVTMFIVAIAGIAISIVVAIFK